MDDVRLDLASNEPARQPEAVAASLMASAIRLIGRPARTASFRHRSINRNSAGASGSSFFNGCRSTPGTAPLTSQLALLISTTTTNVAFIKPSLSIYCQLPEVLRRPVETTLR